MKDVSLEQYNLFKFDSLTGKKTVAEEVKEVAENIDICKDVEEVKQFLENSNINKTKSIFRELTDEQVEELMRAEEESFNLVSEANEIAEETITATESKTLTPDNSPMALEPNKTYNVKLTYGNHTYNYDVTTGATDVQIKYFTTDGALGITGDNVKVKPSSDNEKNNIRFDGSNNKLDLSTAGITNIINNIRYYKTFEGGSSISKDEDTPLSADLTLERGQAEQTLTVTNEEKTVLLTNPFTGSNYTYKVKLKSGQTKSQDVKFKFLENGRLIITGNYFNITAGDNQMDDLIIMGGNNIINTGDCDDIVKVGTNGGVSSWTILQASEGTNTINTGAGDDYVLMYGYYNIDMGEGDNDKLQLAYTYYQKASISNTESVAKLTTVTEDDGSRHTELGIVAGQGKGIDHLDGWGFQKNSPFCMFYTLINSLSHCTGQTNLSKYMAYTYNSNTKEYTVTFPNYSGTKPNSITVTKDEVDACQDVREGKTDNIMFAGDFDSKLLVYSLHKLMWQNAGNKGDGIYSIELAYTYLLGGEKKGVGYYSYTTETDENDEEVVVQNEEIMNNWKQKVIDLYNLYMKDDETGINNMTLAFTKRQKADKSYGIPTSHACGIKEIAKNDRGEYYVIFVNPWDDADNVKILLDDLAKLKVAISIYGYDSTEINAKLNANQS